MDDATGSKFESVKFINSTFLNAPAMDGTQFIDSELLSTNFSNVDLDGVSFSYSNISNSIFIISASGFVR